MSQNAPLSRVGDEPQVLTVVIDASVLFSAPLRDTILRSTERGWLRVLWSRDILQEFRRALIRTGRVTESRGLYLEGALLKAFPEAVVEDFAHLIPTMNNDPKDRHVLAVAVHARADAIITLNLKHFPEPVLAAEGILPMSPDKLLMTIRQAQGANGLIELLTEQAKDLRRPPLSLTDLLSEMVGLAPLFTDQMRRDLAAHRNALNDT